MNVVQSRLFGVAGALGFLAVAAGAFGAHALQDRVTPDRLDVFETAVRYQMFHVLVLLVIALLQPTGGRRGAAIAFLTGIVIFSGSLYALVLLDLPVLGAVTPIGGVALLTGWVLLAFSARSA